MTPFCYPVSLGPLWLRREDKGTPPPLPSSEGFFTAIPVLLRGKLRKSTANPQPQMLDVYKLCCWFISTPLRFWGQEQTQAKSPHRLQPLPQDGGKNSKGDAGGSLSSHCESTKRPRPRVGKGRWEAPAGQKEESAINMEASRPPHSKLWKEASSKIHV